MEGDPESASATAGQEAATGEHGRGLRGDASAGPLERLPAWLAPALVGAAILAFLYENRHVPAQLDDAYIIYRYARNLVEGNGLVYNVGERVEGITTLLWTLLVAAGMWAGFAAPVFAHWLGVGCGVALLVLTYFYAKVGLPPSDRPIAALAPWLVLSTICFAAWTTSGLETPLFAVMVMIALVAEAYGRPVLGVPAAIVASLVRPEGLLLAGVVFAFLFLRRPSERRRWLVLAAVYVLFGVALTAFRLLYFGAPFPNTFYAKVGGVAWWWGSYSLLSFVVQLVLPVLIPVVFARNDPRFSMGVAWTAVCVIHLLLVGGDVFAFCRFFLPSVPVLAAMAVRSLSLAPRQPTRARAVLAALSVPASVVWYAFGFFPGVAALAAVAAVAFAVDRRWARLVAVAVAAGAVFVLQSTVTLPPDAKPYIIEIPFNSRWAVLDHMRLQLLFLTLGEQRIAATLNRMPPANKTVAGIGIGVLGYYCRATIIDLVGLVDRHIASSRHHVSGSISMPGHQRTNAVYVLSRKPDFILTPERIPKELLVPAIVELWQNSEFRRKYVYNPAILGYQRIPDAPTL